MSAQDDGGGGGSAAPFPGAHPQVPGMHRLALSADQERERPLPLESAAVPSDQGWAIRLRVRAELVVTDKQVVVYERVVVRRREIDDVQRLESSVRREELSVDMTTRPHQTGAPRE